MKNGEHFSGIPRREQVDCRYWVEKYLRNEKNQPFNFQEFPFLVDIYDDMSREIVIKKAAQVGITAWAVNRVIWIAANFSITCIFTLPTGNDVSDFSQGRFNPVIRYSKINIPKEVDNVGMKKIGTSFIYLRGTWAEREAISIPSDINVHDEVNFSKPDISEMYEERLAVSPIKMQIQISTPTVPNTGISALYEQTNKKEWFVGCLKCGYQQILTEENIIDDEFRCVKCKAVLDRKKGKWIATGSGKKTGYHLSQLMAPWLSAKDILDKKENARLKKYYYNFVLGEDYAGGDEIVSRADIMACLTDTKDVITTGKTVIGVDWGDTSWVVVRRVNNIIYLEKITGDTRTHPGRVAELMQKFNAYAVCDFGYGDTKNKALIEWFPNRVWQCVYTPHILYPKLNDTKRIIEVDRTLSLLECFEEIKNKKVKIISSPEINVFITHFGNMVEKKIFKQDGDIKTQIERIGDDHYAHAYNYARLLFFTQQRNYEKWSVIEV